MIPNLATPIRLKVPAESIFSEIQPWIGSAMDRSGRFCKGSIRVLTLIGSKASFEGGSPFFDYEQPRRNEEVFRSCPKLTQFLNSIQSPIFKARILTMEPEAAVKPHRDAWLNPEFGVIRLNIPLNVNAHSEVYLEDLSFTPKIGEAWYLNTSYLHGAKNNSKTESRTHLVLDVGLTPFLLSLFPENFFTEVPNVESFGCFTETHSFSDSVKALLPEVFLPLANPSSNQVETEFLLEDAKLLMKFKSYKIPLQMADDGSYFPMHVGPGFKYQLDSKNLRVHLHGAIVSEESNSHRIASFNFQTTYLR